MNYEAFISYRRADKEVAEQIFKALAELKHRVFFDTQSLDAGDFTDHIRQAIQESEMVVSILTCDSIRRMAEDPQKDMVRLELQECRGKDKLVRFFWLQGGDDPQSALYEMLGQYKDDEFFQWLLGQNITPFHGDENGVRETCRLILKAVENGSQRLKLTIRDKEYIYYGETWVTWMGVVFPWGQGTLVENSGEDTFLIYAGAWQSIFISKSDPPVYTGTGTVYRQERGGGRVKVYEGHWTDLLYDDQNGTLYEDDGETVKQQGCFLLKKDFSYSTLKSIYKPDGVPRIVAYAEGNDVPLFRGEAIHDARGIQILAYGRGEMRAPDGCVFTGHFNGDRRPQCGELRIPCGDGFHVYRGQVKEKERGYHETSLDGIKPDWYGRMEYADGSSYEGCWDDGKWRELGVAVIHAPEFDIKIEGSFDSNSDVPIYGGYPDGDNTRELKISLRRQGETDFRLIYYAPENPKRSAVPYRSSGVGTFYYADGSRYEGQWAGKSGKETDWKGNIAGRFLTPDGTEFQPDAAQLRRYEREERAIFDPLWSWAPDKPIQTVSLAELVLQELIDSLLIPTQEFFGASPLDSETFFQKALARLAPDGGKLVLPPELTGMDFASLTPRQLVEILDAGMPEDSPWKTGRKEADGGINVTCSMALLVNIGEIISALAAYAREEAKRAQEEEKRIAALKKPADRGSALPEDAFSFIQDSLNSLSYPYSREKVLLFLNTADNAVCLDWRALPEDETQQRQFLMVRLLDICTDMMLAGA